MERKVTIRKGYISLEWLTSEYRYSSELATTFGTVWDQMRDVEKDYFDLENVYISPINDPSRLIASYPVAKLKKQNVHAALLNDEHHARPRHGAAFERTSRRTFDVGVIMGGLFVQGQVEYPSNVPVDSILSGAGEAFTPVFNAKAKHISLPDVEFENPAIIVNRKLINLFGIS